VHAHLVSGDPGIVVRRTPGDPDRRGSRVRLPHEGEEVRLRGFHVHGIPDHASPVARLVDGGELEDMPAALRDRERPGVRDPGAAIEAVGGRRDAALGIGGGNVTVASEMYHPFSPAIPDTPSTVVGPTMSMR